MRVERDRGLKYAYRIDVIPISRYHRKRACLLARSREAMLVNQHRAAIKAARGNERGREGQGEREGRGRGGLERERSAFESLDNFTLLMHVTLLRSTIGATHATLKRRARNAGVFYDRKREGEEESERERRGIPYRSLFHS